MSNDTTALTTHLQNSQASRGLSLRDRSTALTLRAESNILLLDISGSMSECVNPREPKIDILWGMVQKLRAQNLLFRVAEFNTTCRWSDGILQPEPEGDTDLAGALDFISSASPQQVTVITDGYPNSASHALAAASRLGCKINVFYVGPQSDWIAQEFCREL